MSGLLDSVLNGQRKADNAAWKLRALAAQAELRRLRKRMRDAPTLSVADVVRGLSAQQSHWPKSWGPSTSLALIALEDDE